MKKWMGPPDVHGMLTRESSSSRGTGTCPFHCLQVQMSPAWEDLFMWVTCGKTEQRKVSGQETHLQFGPLETV